MVAKIYKIDTEEPASARVARLLVELREQRDPEESWRISAEILGLARSVLDELENERSARIFWLRQAKDQQETSGRWDG